MVAAARKRMSSRLRALLPSSGRHRATMPPPQPPVIERRLTAAPRRPVDVCRCERERILERRRTLWVAAYGIDAELRRKRGVEVSA